MNVRHTPRMVAVLDHLRREFEIDGAELDDLVEALRLNLQDLRRTIRNLVEAGDWAGLSAAGHSLKGVAANIGQDDLRDAALAVETAAKAGEADAARALVARLETLFTQLGL